MNSAKWLQQFNWLFGNTVVFTKDGQFLNHVPLLVESSDSNTVFKCAQKHSNALHRDRALKYNSNNAKKSKMYPLIAKSAAYASPELQVIAQDLLEKRIFSSLPGVTPWKNCSGYKFTIYEYDEMLEPSADQSRGPNDGVFWRFKKSLHDVYVFREKHEAELYAHACGVKPL